MVRDGHAGSVQQFDLAESMIAALEAASATQESRHALPYLGMARAELAQCRRSPPGRLHEVPVASVPQTLAELERVVSRALEASSDPGDSMRLLAARQLLHEAREAIS